jgi:hypothetical protein
MASGTTVDVLQYHWVSLGSRTLVGRASAGRSSSPDVGYGHHTDGEDDGADQRRPEVPYVHGGEARARAAPSLILADAKRPCLS